ncbi:MAG: hypothetical protein HOJ35_02960 [Bdellovibrionales bacterium]|jgi:hypothetical protein|nr:hypothetical protein [Bdellovibrionales bacterium]
MFMAIAVENSSKNPSNRNNYKVWYLELNDLKEVINIGVCSKERLIESLFKNYQETNRSNWRAFLSESEFSKQIEVFDFVSQNIYENTHFGNLPTLSEFQQTLNCLQMNFELSAIA